MGLYTEEQIKSANAVSLEQYLRSRGEKLARAGREYKWIYKDSLADQKHRCQRIFWIWFLSGRIKKYHFQIF